MPLGAHPDWLERAAFLTEVQARGGPPGSPQSIVLPLAVPELRVALPPKPVESPDEEDLSCRVHRWYGRFPGGRYFTIDLDETRADDGTIRSCVVTTTYPDAGEHDWTSLRALAGLAEVVRLDQVVFVESRTADPAYVVYRHDPRGFDAPVYAAASRDDAASLVAFLTVEQNPCGYAVGSPEARGEWVVVDEIPVPRVIACYPDRTSSLAVACEMTQGTERTLRVKDHAADSTRDQYTVRAGKVL